MSDKKKSFVLHLDSLSILDDMDFEQKGRLIDAIYKFHRGINVELDFGLKMAFAPFKNQFIRDEEKYQEVIKRNKDNGSKGGRPKKQDKPKQTKITHSVFQKPKKADSDSDNVNDNGNDNKNVNKELKYPYSSVGFLQKWETLVSQPKWKKKSHSALQESLNKLSKVSEQDAIEMMSNSISGNWQGIFPLNNKNTPTLFNPQTERPKIGIPEI